MFNRKYISRLFYIHTELPFACFIALSLLAHTLGYLVTNNAFLQAVMAFGALVMATILSCLIYGIYRFEKKYGGAL
jgi:hypothetical protein